MNLKKNYSEERMHDPAIGYMTKEGTETILTALVLVCRILHQEKMIEVLGVAGERVSRDRLNYVYKCLGGITIDEVLNET